MSESAEEDADIRFAAGSRLAPLAVVGLPLALVDGGSGVGVASALGWDGLLLLSAGFSYRRLRKAPPLVQRRSPDRLVVGQEAEVEIEIRNRSKIPMRITVRDDVPSEWDPTPTECVVAVPAFSRRTVTYKIRPKERGRFEFGNIEVRCDDRVGLGAMIYKVEAQESVGVYPNIVGPSRFELAARLGDLSSMGIKNVRNLGGGGEFAQLREYVFGDSYRDVDWKSTAKRRRPITRVLQQERSQQVVLLVDAGRTMDVKSGDLTKLDHAINAALLLSWVGLRQGDKVGLIVFADDVLRYVPPGKGTLHYRRILESLFEVRGKATYSDFGRLTRFIRTRVRKRSMLIMFSDLLDEEHAQPLVEHLGKLRPKHVPVCVSLTDPQTEEDAVSPVAILQDAYRRAAASDLLEERRHTRLLLRRSSVPLVEADRSDLAIHAVNQFLKLKARSLL